MLLPVADAADNFQELILDADWRGLNLLGLVSCLLLCLGLPGKYIVRYEHFRQSGFTGILLACTGLILFTAIQYYETFLWPAGAAVHPEMLAAHGTLVSGNTFVAGGLLVSGLILGIGFILFGVAALRTKMYPRVPVWFLMSGALLFGNGILFPVRTIGLLLFCSGIVWISWHFRKALTA